MPFGHLAFRALGATAGIGGTGLSLPMLSPCSSIGGNGGLLLSPSPSSGGLLLSPSPSRGGLLLSPVPSRGGLLLNPGGPVPSTPSSPGAPPPVFSPGDDLLDAVDAPMTPSPVAYRGQGRGTHWRRACLETELAAVKVPERATRRRLRYACAKKAEAEEARKRAYGALAKAFDQGRLAGHRDLAHDFASVILGSHRPGELSNRQAELRPGGIIAEKDVRQVS